MACSTGESNYYARVMACQEHLSLPQVLEQCGTHICTGIPLLFANQCTVSWAAGESCQSVHAKHIDIKIQFIRRLVKLGIIKVEYVANEENYAYVLTKALSSAMTRALMASFGLIQKPKEGH